MTAAASTCWPASKRAMERVGAVISDFGGVLTSPLLDGFQAFQESSGVPLEELGKAMAVLSARRNAVSSRATWPSSPPMG